MTGVAVTEKMTDIHTSSPTSAATCFRPLLMDATAATRSSTTEPPPVTMFPKIATTTTTTTTSATTTTLTSSSSSSSTQQQQQHHHQEPDMNTTSTAGQTNSSSRGSSGRGSTTTARPKMLNSASRSSWSSRSWGSISGGRSTTTTCLRVGVVLSNTNIVDHAITAMSSPVATCHVRAVVDMSATTTSSSSSSNDDNNHDHHHATNADQHQQQEEEKCPSSSSSGNKLRQWLRRNRLIRSSSSSSQLHDHDAEVKVEEEEDQVRAYRGEDGFQAMLNDDDIDAVYINVRTTTAHGSSSSDNNNQYYDQNRYIMDALHSKKHVLLNDPISTSLVEFTKQLALAKDVNRFIQFSTMFVHHHQVKSFLGQVLHKIGKGRIESIHACFHLNVITDAHKLSIPWPQQQSSSSPVSNMSTSTEIMARNNDGCIRRLGRYCILIGVLIFSRNGSYPISVQYVSPDNKKPKSPQGNGDTNDTTDDSIDAEFSNIVHPNDYHNYNASCIVHFSNHRILTFDVSYSTYRRTRQIVTASTADRYAIMSDYVIPHDDGLATLRIYDRKLDAVTGEIDVVSGESLDVATGVPQDVVMWRRFHQLCIAINDGGWKEQEEEETTVEDKEVEEVGEHKVDGDDDNNKGHNITVTTTKSLLSKSSSTKNHRLLSSSSSSSKEQEEEEEDITKVATTAAMEAREITNIALHTKRILIALLESVQNGGSIVEL